MCRGLDGLNVAQQGCQASLPLLDTLCEPAIGFGARLQLPVLR